MERKIAFLHGLESNNSGPKNDWLRTIAEVYDPLIDYRQSMIFQKIKNEIIEFKPKLIIGSSMGGFFSYELAKELNIPAVLFNPALHSRTFTPDMTGMERGKFRPEMVFILGLDDDIINPLETINIVSEDGYTKENIVILPHVHRTPYEVFVREIESFCKDILPTDYF